MGSGRMSVWVLLGTLPCLGGLAPAAEVPPSVQVEDRFFDIQVEGAGSPTVVLVSALGTDNLLQWLDVQSGVAGFATTLAYAPRSTAGDGSNPAPRSSVEVARELEGLLGRLELPPPYLLVGHSSGGFHVRVFATLFPDLVAGLVLVDASHERFFQSLDQLEAGAFKSAIRRMEARSGQRSALANREFAGFRDVIVAGVLPHGAPLPEVPLVVLTSVQQVAEPRGLIESAAATRLWRDLHAEWLDTTPLAIQITTDASGHYIHAEQPQLVVDAIREAIERSATQLSTAARRAPRDK